MMASAERRAQSAEHVLAVTPAHAGVQRLSLRHWTPAYAGVTNPL